MATPPLCFLHWLNTEKELSKAHHETLLVFANFINTSFNLVIYLAEA